MYHVEFKNVHFYASSSVIYNVVFVTVAWNSLVICELKTKHVQTGVLNITMLS